MHSERSVSIRGTGEGVRVHTNWFLPSVVTLSEQRNG